MTAASHASAGDTLTKVLRQAAKAGLKHFRTTPFTLAVLTAFVGAGAATGSFLAGPPESMLSFAASNAEALKAGRWWSLFTSMFFATNPAAYLAAAAMILLLLGFAERALGPVHTAVFYFGGQFASVTLFLLITQLAQQAGDPWLGSMVNAPLMGPYAPVLAASLAASGLFPALWQRRLRTAALSTALLLVLYVGHAEAVVGLLGALLGLAAGWWIQTDKGTLHRHRSTGRETRNLLALTVAIFAIGPILTAAARSAAGPLALLRNVVLNPLPTLSQLEENCGGTLDAGCLELDRQGLGGPLGLALAVVPVILLLICADGMRRGRKMALWIAIAVQLSVAALSAVYLALFARIAGSGSVQDTAALESKFVHVLPLVAVPVLLVVLLVAHRRHFRIQTSSRALRVLALTVGGTWLVLASLYTASWFAAGGPGRDGGLLVLAGELARQYLPVPLPGLYRRVFENRSALETVLFAYSGVIFWIVALAGVWIVLLGRHDHSDAGAGDREAARELVRRGGDSLSWMALWEPNKYWFLPGGGAGIAYQQHGSVALTLAGPFGDPLQREEAAEGFLRFCAEHALIPCFYSCTDGLWPMLSDRGFSRVSVAQETRLSVRELEFKGKEWQNVRTALNRAKKLGVEARWGNYSSLPQSLRTQLSEVSEEWAAQKTVPEMGFTLGGVDELMDDDVLCCLAVDGQGLVHGVTSWLPAYEHGHVVSWTLDFMRRRGEGFPGAMEFLIASAVLELRKSVETISLSGSPLAQDSSVPGGGGREQGTEVLSGILDVVGRALEPIYGFRSLATFKSRFKPQYRTLYLYYQDPLQLPAIGRALSRAYLPGLSIRQSARLLRTLVR
ncbi:MAG: rhomboid family intrarane serine protease [Arthrobacter sp.]|nr:rhomboid family intrarane serine protease [Arthrobacter sp.]